MNILVEVIPLLNWMGLTKHNNPLKNKENVFELSRKDLQIVLSKDDIKTIFSTLKNQGKLCINDLYSTLFIYGDIILDFFLQLPYIVKNEDKIVLNYTKKSDELEVLEFDN